MTFCDSQLQECYDGNLRQGVDRSDEVREVRALIATHDTFQMLEGAHSQRVHETITCLLRPEHRPGLRRWFQRAGVVPDRASGEFRSRLSQLAGEQFGPVPAGT